MKTLRIPYVSEFAMPAAEVWPALADTNRVNALEATIGPFTVVEEPQPDGSVVRSARGWIGPLPGIRWQEGVGEWIEQRYVHQVRKFTSGPFDTHEVTVHVSEKEGKTQLKYEFVATWNSLSGDLLNLLRANQQITAKVVRGVESRAAVLSARTDVAKARKPPALGQAARERLQSCLDEIKQGPFGHALEQKLADYLTAAEAIDLKKIRPIALARSWDVPLSRVVELCIAAQQSGLLTMRWELLCPRCRGGKAATENLYELPRGTHCDSCNIDYERDFTRNIELVFSVPPWLRKVPEGEFCMMGAASTPHVKVQLHLPAGEVRQESVSFAPGRYRLRTVEAGGECEIDCDGQAFPECVIDGRDVSAGPLAPPGQLVMRNTGALDRTVVVEEYAWVGDALTGARAISIPAFRELHPEQLLRPGDDVAVGRVAIMFTDLKRSTVLYNAIGDSAAYGLVRDHFAFLADCIRRQQGILVKTIGDSVMAAFIEPAAAFRSALEIQQGVADFNAKHELAEIEIKIGLHQGECIAVTTAGILDYFGTTVNTAARLQDQSHGHDIVLSAAMLDDPVLAKMPEVQKLQAEQAMLEGFSEAMVFYRFAENSMP